MQWVGQRKYCQAQRRHYAMGRKIEIWSARVPVTVAQQGPSVTVGRWRFVRRDVATRKDSDAGSRMGESNGTGFATPDAAVNEALLTRSGRQLIIRQG